MKEGIAEVNFVLQQNIPNAIFDITLARGADYYTGCIFEVIGKNETFGALGGGGRYDNLTEMFGKKDLTGVGISFGFERIFDLLESLDKYPESLSIAPKLIFLHLGENEKMFAFKLLQSVRNAGISSEIYPDDAKLKKQMNYANDKKIAYTCIIGSTEMENELLTLKNMITGTQQTVTLEELINILQTN